MTNDKVAQTIGNGSPGIFMHGPTFMANPLACVAAKASLEILAQGNWKTQTAAIAEQLRTELAPAKSYTGVKDVRVLGGIGVIEMDHTVSADVAHGFAKENGVYLRPFSKNIYTMPPFISTPDELSQITAAMLKLAKVL